MKPTIGKITAKKIQLSLTGRTVRFVFIELNNRLPDVRNELQNSKENTFLRQLYSNS